MALTLDPVLDTIALTLPITMDDVGALWDLLRPHVSRADGYLLEVGLERETNGRTAAQRLTGGSPPRAEGTRMSVTVHRDHARVYVRLIDAK